MHQVDVSSLYHAPDVSHARCIIHDHMIHYTHVRYRCTYRCMIQVYDTGVQYRYMIQVYDRDHEPHLETPDLFSSISFHDCDVPMAISQYDTNMSQRSPVSHSRHHCIIRQTSQCDTPDITVSYTRVTLLCSGHYYIIHQTSLYHMPHITVSYTKHPCIIHRPHIPVSYIIVSYTILECLSSRVCVL